MFSLCGKHLAPFYKGFLCPLFVPEGSFRFRKWPKVVFLLQEIQNLIDGGVSPASICVVARTNKLLERYQPWIERSGLPTYTIKRTQPDARTKEGVRFATMHRVKGLEFEHLFLVAAERDVIPLQTSLGSAEDAAARRQLDVSERSLLYVALTRAQRSATISGIGEMSPFLARATPSA